LTIEPNGLPGREDNSLQQLRMPAVGVRYWLSEKIGLDIGVGLGVLTEGDDLNCIVEGDACTSAQVGGVDGGFGVRLHFGLPVALTTFEHFNILLTPEIGFQYGQATFFAPAGPVFDVDVSAIALDIGVKIGGELQFGFWGVPNLALQANIGIGLRYASRTGSNSVLFDNPGAIVDQTTSGISIRTMADDLAGVIRIVYYIN
ncbi:MAG: hypothetical protein AAF645_24680, partial [Myxococcota bacterium]